MARLLTCFIAGLFSLSAFASPDLVLFSDAHALYLVDPGTTGTLTINFRNLGPDPAQNVVLHIPFPPGANLVAFNAPDGWSCSATDAGAVCSTATVAGGGFDAPNTTFTATLALSSDENGYNWYDVATVTSDTPDSFPGNNRTQISSIVYRRLHVSSTADSGSGSLRDALAAANARCSEGVPCKMTFDLPAHSTIAPLTPLPAIEAGYLLIDGDQNRSGDRAIELSGANLTKGNGLDVHSLGTSGNSNFIQLFGLAINDFPDFGVVVRGTDATVVLRGLFVGTDSTGTLAKPNGRGIGLYDDRANVSVNDSIISGNVHSGIFQWGSGFLSIDRSLIGVGSDGSTLGNGNSGVFAYRGAFDISNTTIANNGQFGVSIEPDVPRASIEGTEIFANGIEGIDWGLNGAGSSRVPPPVLTDAVYDPATDQTIITGSIAPSQGPLISIELFANRGRNNFGRAEGEKLLGAVFGKTAFTFAVKGDLRGQIITATLNVGPYLDAVPTLTSEFSDGVVVH